MESPKLSHYKNPPIRETVLGVQFPAIPGFTAAHLGAFWKYLGEGWPQTIEAPPVLPTFEDLSESGRWQTKGQSPPPKGTRLQIRNEADDRMLQVQSDRFLYNWLGESGGAYPRYNVVRPEFDNYYSKFRAFLQENDLELPTENQWEVTYVNHIEKGELWNSVADWPRIYRPAEGIPATVAATKLWSTNGEISFDIEPGIGRLRVRHHHARKLRGTGPEFMVIQLTARGGVKDDGTVPGSVSEGLDLGRKIIVQAFDELTAPEAQRHWEREDL